MCRFLSARETSAQWTAATLETVQPSPEARLRLTSSASVLTLPFPSIFGESEGDADRLALSAMAEPLHASGKGAFSSYDISEVCRRSGILA